jgi:hypothetical protein
MTQEDFQNALRSLSVRELPPPPSAHDIAHALLVQDHRRTRTYALLALFFWAVGTAGLIWLVLALNRLVIFLRIAPGLPWSWPDKSKRYPVDDMLWGTNLIHHSMPYLCAAIACMMLAAVFTVMMIYSSQRATLARINLSLAALAEQLKEPRTK